MQKFAESVNARVLAMMGTARGSSWPIKKNNTTLKTNQNTIRTEYLQIVYKCYEIYIRLNIQPQYKMSDWNKTNLFSKDKIYLPSV